MDEYFQSGHTEPVLKLIMKTLGQFYLPIHIVRKELSTIITVRAVFDDSAKFLTGVSLNGTLLIGPTVHSLLDNVLLHFLLYRIALTTDISPMYQAVSFTHSVVACNTLCVERTWMTL